MTRTLTLTGILLILLTVGAVAQPNYSVLDKPARDILSDAKPGDIVHMVVFMAEQPDRAKLEDMVRGLPRNARSEVVWNEIDNLARRTQGDLLDFIDKMDENGNVERYNTLRICNGILLWATPEVIEAVSYRDDIAWIHGDYLKPLADWDPTPVALDELDEYTWSVDLLGAPMLWDFGWTGEGVLVAVIDGGVDYNHADLADHLWDGGEDFPNHGYNFADDNDDPMDTNGHGTHVSGIICGDGTGGIQTGIAPDATLMCLKVQTSTAVEGYEATMWAAMDMCIEQGVDVMNMSLGMLHIWEPADSAWRANFEIMDIAGIASCVAAGNEGASFAPPTSIRVPATCPSPWRSPFEVEEGTRGGVIAVGATNEEDLMYYNSSRGPVTWQDIPDFLDYLYDEEHVGLIRPDVSAPGFNITSLDLDSGYVAYSGTSMASPSVAGTIALMLSLAPELTTIQIDSLLQTTAIDYGDSGKDNDYGSGRIDPLAVMMACPNNWGDVVGTVRNANTDAIIPNVAVNLVLTLEAGLDTFVVVADSMGEFTFPMPSGTHSAFADYPPYAHAELTGIEVSAGETTYFNMLLPIGLFSPTPDTLEATVSSTSPEEFTITVLNDGTASIDVMVEIEPAIADSDLTEFMDEHYSMSITDIIADNAVQGIESVGQYLYVTGSNNYTNPNYIYKITNDGEYIQSFEQPGSNLPGANATGMRDLAYDGTYLYGSYDHRIMVMDPENCNLVRTIDGPFDRHPALAFDPTNGLLWVTAGGQDMVGLNPETGEEVARFECGLFVSGLVYNPLGEDGNTMLLAGQTLNGTPLDLYTVNPDSQRVEYYLEVPGVANEALKGIGVVPIYDTYYSVLTCLLQHPTGDRVAGFELQTYVPFAEYTPQEFTIGPDETQDITVTLDYVGYDNGVYAANLIATHNTLEEVTVMPVLMTVAVGVEFEDDQVELPNEFALHAPYPNPFNSTTVVGFDLPRNEVVSLIIYDVLGREVANLAHQQFTAGTHKLSFNGARLASGMYFVRMKTDNGFVQSRKMLLLK